MIRNVVAYCPKCKGVVYDENELDHDLSGEIHQVCGTRVEYVSDPHDKTADNVD